MTDVSFSSSFQAREGKGSPKKRVDVRLSRTSSMERGKEREEAWSFDGASESRWTAAKESEENKENLMVDSELKDDLLLYQDEEVLNDSVISGEEGPAKLGPEAESHQGVGHGQSELALPPGVARGKAWPGCGETRAGSGGGASPETCLEGPGGWGHPGSLSCVEG